MSKTVLHPPLNLLLLGRGPILEALISEILQDPLFSRLFTLCGFVGDRLNFEQLQAALGRCNGSINYIPGDVRTEAQIIDLIARCRIDALISVQYSWILSSNVLDAVQGQAFNLHNAKLPDYRGHHALSHEILNGETQHTVTIHRMASRVDFGTCVLERSIPIHPDETAQSLGRRSVVAAVQAFRSFLERLADQEPSMERPIPEGGRFYSRRLLDGLRQIHFLSDPQDIDRKARAFHYPPYEPAYLMIDGRKYYVVPASEETQQQST